MPASRKPTLFVHIGTNKTGTTALQTALARQRDELARAGLVYPRGGVHADAHHPLGWQCGFILGPAPATPEAPERIVAGWRAEIAAHPGALGLVSSEFLCLDGQIARLRELLAGFEVHVVVYLRRHDSWLQSVYVQAVKSVLEPRWGRGYTAYLRFTQRVRHRLDSYRWLVDRWAEAFGEERVIVRPFERAQNGDNILVDLLRTIGAGGAAAAVPGQLARENESLSFEAVSFLDIVNHTGLPADVKRHLAREMIAHDDGRTRGVSYASPGVRREQVRAQADDYDYLARRYLRRADGVLFVEPWPDACMAWSPPTPPTCMWAAQRVCEYLGRADDALIDALRAHARAGTGAP